jgi:Spy/CpxP family protein refolding chaperone
MKRSLFAVPVLVGALALSACGGSVEAGPAATAQSAATKAPIATSAQGGHVKLVSEALGEVSLRADQRSAIEQLAAEAETRHAATKQVRAEIANALAAQIEAGKIDRAALQPKIDAAAQAWEASRPADRAALEKLHAILDKDQRSAFVDALVAKIHAAHASHDGHHEGKAHLEKLAADLKLTDDQRAQIGTILHGQMKAHHGDWKEGREKGKAMMEAFKGDHFVMSEVAPPVDVRAKANAMSDHILGVIEQVLPILTPEQRTIAASKIRERGGDVMELSPGQ